MATIRDIITQTALKHGIDPAIPLAVAWQESKWKPKAVGDGGTSFGLFQLHQGGQLGDRSAEWAFNPWNNAEQAISVMAETARDHPTWSPGEIAVGSQRPAEEVRPEYIANVNKWVPQIKSGQFPPVGDGADVPGGPTPGTGPVPGADQAGYQQAASPAALIRLLGPAIRFFGQMFSRVGRAGQHAGRVGRRTPADDAAFAFGRAVALLSLPNLGIRLVAGILGVIFLLIGIVLFATK